MTGSELTEGDWKVAKERAKSLSEGYGIGMIGRLLTKKELLKDPFSARRLIEAREAEAQLRSRPLSAGQRKAESVRVEDLERMLEMFRGNPE